MALPLSLQFPTLSLSSSPQSKTRRTILFANPNKHSLQTLTLTIFKQTRTRLRNRNQHFSVISAIEERRQETESESESSPEPEIRPAVEVSEIGQEIKKAMEERKKKEEEGGDFWGGVAAEVKEIEWPAFGKVIGTTGVVLGVIAGSSVVLLTVNAVLAELSDRVFAGRGVQDFFG